MTSRIITSAAIPPITPPTIAPIFGEELLDPDVGAALVVAAGDGPAVAIPPTGGAAVDDGLLVFKHELLPDPTVIIDVLPPVPLPLASPATRM